MIRLLLLLLLPFAASAQETVRLATFNTELSREGPGLLLRDIAKGNDPQVAAVIEVITEVDPDILILQGLDWDHDNRALAALANRLSEAGSRYAHSFSAQPNSGLMTEEDLDGDGRTRGPADAQGFGRFTGQGGIAALSKYPIDDSAVQNFSDLLWRDLPGAELPVVDGAPFPSPEALDAQRLSSTAHWVLPITLPDGPLYVLTYQATPPVFDGPEDRNGLRNKDETRFWSAFLDGQLGPAPQGRFAIMGGSNLDPNDSDGYVDTMKSLLEDERLQDPRPSSRGAALAADQGHITDNALDTVDWPRVGRLRVDYILPSAEWSVVASGVFWPEPGQSGYGAALEASRHRLVWVDLALP